MSWFLAAFFALAAAPQTKNLDALLDGVQSWFARLNDFSADFEENYVDDLNQKGLETGRVFLKRENMMRWEYKSVKNPKAEDKLYISDGKTFFSYIPADKVVHRDALKNVADERMPMMFLLGRSNLRDEFTQFRELSEKPKTAGSRVVAMTPRKKSDLMEIKMEVDPATSRVRRLELIYSGGARSAYTFNNIDDKTKRDARFFEFRIPDRVDVIDGF